MEEKEKDCETCHGTNIDGTPCKRKKTLSSKKKQPKGPFYCGPHSSQKKKKKKKN